MDLYVQLGEIAPEPVKLSMTAIVDASSIRDTAGLDELRSM